MFIHRAVLDIQPGKSPETLKIVPEKKTEECQQKEGSKKSNLKGRERNSGDMKRVTQ